MQRNIANAILESMGMATGWDKGVEPSTVTRRLNKINNALEGKCERERRYAKRYTHVLSEHIADKNKAIIANRKRAS